MSTISSDTKTVVQAVLENLSGQHSWSLLETHTRCSTTGLPLPRTIISGLPPRRLYIHPDEQIEALELEKSGGKPPPQTPEFEWVLPVFLAESWSLHDLADVFASISPIPRPHVKCDDNDSSRKWNSSKRGKRLLLGIVHNDSTVLYYLVHDGIVKPRPN